MVHFFAFNLAYPAASTPRFFSLFQPTPASRKRMQLTLVDPELIWPEPEDRDALADALVLGARGDVDQGGAVLHRRLRGGSGVEERVDDLPVAVGDRLEQCRRAVRGGEVELGLALDQ